MLIELPSQIIEIINANVESGRYPDPGQVVAEALRLLDDRDRLEILRALIAEGDAAIDRGEDFEWTPDSMAELMRALDEEDRKAAHERATGE